MAKGTSSASPDSILSITMGNKLLSIQVSVCYHRHMLQQACYKEVPYSLSRGTPPQKCAFLDTSQYPVVFVVLEIFLEAARNTTI
jgi:hypothetical protein